MEWRLWESDEPPYFTTEEFFKNHPHIDPAHQIGHAERIDMVVGALKELVTERPDLHTLTDLGCGDGSFLVHARDMGLSVAGYDAGEANVAVAQSKGLDVAVDDIRDLMVMSHIVALTEVLEHLVAPHNLLDSLDARWLIATSPLGEDDTWHYEHHAWAWDALGYVEMIENAGWIVEKTYACASSRTHAFGPSWVQRPLTFQCVVASRP